MSGAACSATDALTRRCTHADAEAGRAADAPQSEAPAAEAQAESAPAAVAPKAAPPARDAAVAEVVNPAVAALLVTIAEATKEMQYRPPRVQQRELITLINDAAATIQALREL